MAIIKSQFQLKGFPTDCVNRRTDTFLCGHSVLMTKTDLEKLQAEIGVPDAASEPGSVLVLVPAQPWILRSRRRSRELSSRKSAELSR
jgi:hypothetical protein